MFAFGLVYQEAIAHPRKHGRLNRYLQVLYRHNWLDLKSFTRILSFCFMRNFIFILIRTVNRFCLVPRLLMATECLCTVSGGRKSEVEMRLSFWTELNTV